MGTNVEIGNSCIPQSLYSSPMSTSMISSRISACSETDESFKQPSSDSASSLNEELDEEEKNKLLKLRKASTLYLCVEKSRFYLRILKAV